MRRSRQVRTVKPEPGPELPPERVVAFSGGKDSTAMVLRLHELGELSGATLLFTATGNELPGLGDHMERVCKHVGAPLTRPANKSLAEWIEFYGALPNWRQRWCTRQIKVEPCAAYLARRPGSTLLVGLRADEEEREGLYGPYAEYRYPLREWGWGIDEVWSCVRAKGFSPPARTDCAVCPFQRLGEWYRLWRDNPDHFAQGERWEQETGHTFRSPQRDTWPAGLAGLRERFEAGEVPRGGNDNPSDPCRVCRL